MKNVIVLLSALLVSFSVFANEAKPTSTEPTSTEAAPAEEAK